MYEMLTKEINRPAPETIQDLIDEDFKVLFHSEFYSEFTQILFEVQDGDLM
jgi:hypothetical protein